VKNLMGSFQRYLLEDSRGSIVNQLGLPPACANALHRETPKHAYLLGHIAILFYGMEQIEHLAEKVASLGVGEERAWDDFVERGILRATMGGIPQMGERVLALLEKKPHLAKKMKAIDNDSDIIALLAPDDLQSRQEEREVLHSFDDGMQWVYLGRDGCSWEAIHMRHCGTTDPRFPGVLISLRRTDDHHPSITMTVDGSDNTIVDLKGRGNSAPDQKYWEYITAYLDKTEAKLKGVGTGKWPEKTIKHFEPYFLTNLRALSGRSMGGDNMNEAMKTFREYSENLGNMNASWPHPDELEAMNKLLELQENGTIKLLPDHTYTRKIDEIRAMYIIGVLLPYDVWDIGSPEDGLADEKDVVYDFFGPIIENIDCDKKIGTFLAAVTFGGSIGGGYSVLARETRTKYRRANIVVTMHMLDNSDPNDPIRQHCEEDLADELAAPRTINENWKRRGRELIGYGGTFEIRRTEDRSDSGAPIFSLMQKRTDDMGGMGGMKWIAIATGSSVAALTKTANEIMGDGRG